MAASGPLARDYRVGDWFVRPRLARLERGDDVVHLAPRVMAVLVRLAEANGAVVTRAELLDSVWPRMDVSHDALSQCVVELRKAFGDNSKSPSVIETIPKLGLRLIAPVTAIEAVSEQSRPDRIDASHVRGGGQSTAGASTDRPQPRVAPVVGAALVLALAAAVFLLVPTSKQMSATERSIAVLPFGKDSTGDEDVEFFANGVHDELLSRLSGIPAFERVISRTSVMDYRDTTKNVRQIGEELGVATLLEGRVQRAGEAVRIHVRLVDVLTDSAIWSDTYAESLSAENIFAIQSSIAVAIADALRAELSDDDLARLGNVPTRSARAHDFYVSGNEYFNRSNRLTALPLAVQMYQQATAADPDFALAWARLGTAHIGIYWYGVDRTQGRLELAATAINRAFELVPNLPEAHLARANFYYHGVGDLERALIEFDIAERSMQRNSELHFLRASVYRRLGQLEQSIEEMKKAIDLDPRNRIYLRQQHYSFMFLRDYVQAEQLLDRILSIAPDDSTAYVDKVALALSRDGDTALVKRLNWRIPDDDYGSGQLHTYTFWLAAIFDRDFERALQILVTAPEDEVFDGDFRISYIPKDLLLARTHALAGNADEARQLFARVAARLERQLRSDGDDAVAQTARYLALAEARADLGDNAQAHAYLRDARRLLADAGHRDLGGGMRLVATIRVLIPAGYVEEALQELDTYLSGNGAWSAEGLSSDPRLAVLVKHPRFTALLEKHGRRGV